ncbi:hypothetical protein F2Q69_00045041 [Brassica cretica]|uniref:Cyclin N-terminal domain-containing protein n=1 Tax=Brassica cretica TaxID=69181 RepID=A0A8S9NM43_BRACR|nr:hypothetical protein F2Q69_00045041 [Brassica cretica]
MDCSSTMHPNANKENVSTSDAEGGFGRITRSRAKKALGGGGVSIPPTKPSFKQQKKRSVLQDVSNTSAGNIYSDLLGGGNFKVAKKSLKQCKKAAKGGADVAMEILDDMHTEKSKLAEDLSKIRMAESLNANLSNSKDEEITEQQEDGSGAMDFCQVVDIDSNDKDPQCCSLYAADIYDNINVAELQPRPLANYMELVQRDIDPAMRRILIDWLVEVSSPLIDIAFLSVEMEFLANYLAELTLVEYNFLRFLPSLVAASAVFLARWTLDQTEDPWNPTLQHYTRYDVAELKTAVLAMEDLQLNTSGCTLTATREKYNQAKFKSVAKLASPKRVTPLFSG